MMTTTEHVGRMDIDMTGTHRCEHREPHTGNRCFERTRYKLCDRWLCIHHEPLYAVGIDRTTGDLMSYRRTP